MFFCDTVNRYLECVSENNNFSGSRVFSDGIFLISIVHPILPIIEISDNAIDSPPLEQSCADLIKPCLISESTVTCLTFNY